LRLVNGILTVTASLEMNLATAVYVVSNAPVLVCSNAAVGDGGSLTFGGGTLTVACVTNAASGDWLGVLHGTNAGQIQLQGTNIACGGAFLATFAGGDGTNALVFSLSTNATSGTLTALLQRMAFSTTNTATGSRTIELALVYGQELVTTQCTLKVDRLPVAVETVIFAAANSNIIFAISQVLTNDTDPDGDTLTIASYDGATTHGYLVADDGTNFTYRPSASFVGEDSFTYVVEDGFGGETRGTVKLEVLAAGACQIDVSDMAQSGADVKITGTAGQVYQIQVSTDLQVWTLLETVTATPLGIIAITDAEARKCPQRFYRVIAQ
jgi:hypothetical protein